MAEKETLKPCPKCGRAVRIRQEWHYNQTRLAIHCKCGRHAATAWTWRGDPMIPRELLVDRWNREAR